jgi:membrane dipeptidase
MLKSVANRRSDGVVRTWLSISQSHQGPQFNEVPYVKVVENPAEVFPNVTRWLVGHGYSRTDIAKVLGLNIVRVLKDAWWR